MDWVVTRASELLNVVAQSTQNLSSFCGNTSDFLFVLLLVASANLFNIHKGDSKVHCGVSH